IEGVGYAKDPISGDVVVDGRETLPKGGKNANFGMPLRSSEREILGKAQPDFYLGLSNEISFSDFRFSFQLDWKNGGKVSSGLNKLANLYGTVKETEDRERDFIFGGKKGYYQDGELVILGDNDIPIRQNLTYANNQYAINEASIYDASFVKLREIRLSYMLNNLGTFSSL